MHKLPIKPLSVNKCWKGQRFKTNDYKEYEDELSFILPRIIVPQGKLKLSLIFGFSSKASDIDNPVKPFQDILSQCYGFNDKMIYEQHVKKIDVPKGEEFIDFGFSDIIF